MMYQSTVKRSTERARRFDAWLAGQDGETRDVVEYHLTKLAPILGQMGQRELLAQLYDFVGRNRE